MKNKGIKTVRLQLNFNNYILNYMKCFNICPFLFQYYEMSYGLNVEMHKQVSDTFCYTKKIEKH